jgi:hypothetical protein
MHSASLKGETGSLARRCRYLDASVQQRSLGVSPSQLLVARIRPRKMASELLLLRSLALVQRLRSMLEL